MKNSAVIFHRKTIAGIVLGICGTLATMWIYRVFLLEKTIPYNISISVTDSTLNKVNIKEAIRELDKDETVVEKLASTNKRLDDVLIFGGIIVTLLLAINVGVYVKAEDEVESHLRKNMGIVQEKMNEKLAEIEQISQKATVHLEILKQKGTQTNQTQTQVSNDNGS